MPKWFTLFYNNTTEKFTSYFDKFLKFAEQQILVFPADIQEGGYSTAFGGGVTPDQVIIDLRSEQEVKSARIGVSSTFKNELNIWEERPRVVVHRLMKWRISHLPSLQLVSPKEYMFITKSEEDHTVIVAVLLDAATHKETRSFKVGSNEDKYPTDCVSLVTDNASKLFIALNKRTKSSDPF